MIEFVFGYFLNPKNSITHTPVTRLESPTESNLIKGAVHVLNLLAKRVSQQRYQLTGLLTCTVRNSQ